MTAAEARRVPQLSAVGPRAIALAAGTIALVAISAVVLIGQAPVAWWLLGLCGVVVVVVLTVSIAEGRYFEPLTVMAAFAAVALVVRPLYLFANSTELISFIPIPSGSSPVKSLLQLDHTEIAMFATTRLRGPLQPAITRAIGACTVFVVLFVAAYLIPIGKRLGRRLATAGRRATEINLRTAVAVSLAIGLMGQAAIVYKTGGLSKATNNQIAQKALQAGLVYYFLAGFTIAGVIVWATWAWPRTRRAWIGLTVAALEPCLFYALIGSRTHVLAVVLPLVVVAHYRWRPLRLRTVLGGFVIGLIVAAALLGVRQATTNQPFTRALGSAPAYIVDPRGTINNVVWFDQIFYTTSSVGVTLHYRHGGWLVDAFRSYVPHFIDPHKPRPPDVTFREDVFGNKIFAGRPPTAVGDLYFDFGFWGVAVGAVLIAFGARALLELLAGSDAPGREFRVALYGVSLFVLYELISNGYAIAIGHFLTVVVPFLIAALVFGRIRSRAARAVDIQSSGEVRRAGREHALLKS